MASELTTSKVRFTSSLFQHRRLCNAVLWPLGRSAVKALLSPAYAKTKNTPKITSEEEAHNLLHNIIPFTFFLRVDRGQPAGSASSPKSLQINQMQLFKPDEYYAWFYEGSQWTNYVGGVAMVAIILAGVMFPLWPPILRLGVWYLSLVFLGLIGLLLVISVIRLIFYVITVLVASPGIWIFPRLFADVGFVRPHPYRFALSNLTTTFAFRSTPSSHSGNGTFRKRSRRRKSLRKNRIKAKVRAAVSIHLTTSSMMSMIRASPLRTRGREVVERRWRTLQKKFHDRYVIPVRVWSHLWILCL
jgi:translocation protein SEC62